MGLDLLRLHSDQNRAGDCTPCVWSLGVRSTLRRALRHLDQIWNGLVRDPFTPLFDNTVSELKGYVQ